MGGDKPAADAADAASEELVFVTDLFRVFQRRLGVRVHGQGVHPDANLSLPRGSCSACSFHGASKGQAFPFWTSPRYAKLLQDPLGLNSVITNEGFLLPFFPCSGLTKQRSSSAWWS